MSGAYFDVCIVCALAIEAEAFMTVVEDKYKVPFAQDFSTDKRAYRYTTIRNSAQESLNVQLSWLPRYGPIETALHVKSLLHEFNPRFVGMSGICAGDKRAVKLGDLVLAERAFNVDSGKIVIGADGASERRYDTYTASCARDVLQYARLFKQWETSAKLLPRPTEGWSETHPFGNLVPLPKDGRPIEAWSRRDQALYEVAKGIREVVDELDGKGKKRF